MTQAIDVRASISDVRELNQLLRELCDVAKEAAPLLAGFTRAVPVPPQASPLLFPQVSDTNGSHPESVHALNGFDREVLS